MQEKHFPQRKQCLSPLRSYFKTHFHFFFSLVKLLRTHLCIENSFIIIKTNNITQTISHQIARQSMCGTSIGRVQKRHLSKFSAFSSSLDSPCRLSITMLPYSGYSQRCANSDSVKSRKVIVISS